MNAEDEMNRQAWNHSHARRQETSFDSRNGELSRNKLPEYFWQSLACGEGDSVLHCLCGDGDELLTVVRESGAVKGLGIDLSDVALESATEKAATLGARCEFVRGEVVEVLARQEAGLASVGFTTLGSLWWIRDLRLFFRELRRVVRNRFVIWDFHPIVYTLDEQCELVGSYPFVNEAILHGDGIEDYWDSDELAQRPRSGGPVIEYRRSLGEILTLAAAAGWRLVQIQEFGEIFGERYFSSMVSSCGGAYIQRSGRTLPLSMVIALA